MPEKSPEPLINPFPEASREDWEARARKALKGRPADELTSLTADGIVCPPLADTGDAAQVPAEFGMPGGGTEVRAFVSEADARTANDVILAELEGGAGSILLQTAASGQPGLGVTGAAELEEAFANVYLDAAGVWLRGPSALSDDGGSPLLDLWSARSIAPADRHGGLGIDPLGWLAAGAAGEAIAERASAAAPALLAALPANSRVSAFTASALPYHDAGATEAQELATLVATALAYLREAAAAGADVETAASVIDLELAADADLFLSIGKLRAARLLWGKVLEECGAAGARVRMHAQTSARMMADKDIPVNMLRATSASLAAGIGGADTVTVLPHTYVLGRPDSTARRIARNAPIILREESSIGAVADPAAGSDAIEHLTLRLCETAWALFQEIEGSGGMVAALRSGLVRNWIARSASAREARIDDGSIVRVGVNRFTDSDEDVPGPDPQAVEPPLRTAYSLS